MMVKIPIVLVLCMVTSTIAPNPPMELGCRKLSPNDPQETCYSAIAVHKTHQQARDFCEAEVRGQLARILDVSTCSFLKMKMRSRFSVDQFPNLWIAAKYDTNQWKWPGDNSPVRYGYWASGHPVNGQNRCAFIDRSQSWYWKSDSCDALKFVLCEYKDDYDS